MPKVINNRIATAASEIASDACHSLRHATKSHRSGATIAKIPKAFLVQSNYVAWLFAVEILQTLYRWAVGRGVYSSVAAAAITAVAIGLSVPATVQHFIYWRNPGHFFGNGKPFGKQLQSYDRETLAVTEFLTKDAHPGDVVFVEMSCLHLSLRLPNAGCRSVISPTLP